uniref:Uncharacterized protein n=1 Tax=Oryza barthii TaxID=65489 RepID=A0A0D3H4I5_9ORYZ
MDGSAASCTSNSNTLPARTRAICIDGGSALRLRPAHGVGPPHTGGGHRTAAGHPRRALHRRRHVGHSGEVPARLRHLLLHARLTCLVVDFCHPWASELAAGLAAPRLTFFSIFGAYDSVADDNAPVVVPSLARRIEVTRAQALGFFCVPGWDKFADDVECRLWAAMARRGRA